MHRRPFLRVLGAALLAPSAACNRAASSAGPGPTVAAGRKRLGIQLYTLRDAARADLPKTLGDIAAVGYTDVELLGSMNNFGAPPKLLRDTLDRLGLRAPSTHVGASVFGALDRTLEDAAVLGHEYVIVAGFPADRTRTLDDWRRWADEMNAAGAVARRRNIWMGFHTHAGDYKLIDGQVGYDVFMDRTDPAVTRHQLDIGNTAMAGIDPATYLDRYNDRYWSFHVKDVPRLGPTTDVELGTGVLDFPALLGRIDRVREKHLFVEQETYPGDPLESVRRDYAYMRRIGY